MDKSIETTWKEGFLKSDALVAPKLNNLYKLKSKDIIDKFKRMGKRNLYGVTIGAIFILIVSFIAGVPYAGAFIFLLLLVVVMVGIKQGKELAKINKSASSYEYLKAFDNWLKDSISEYSRLYRYVYPLLFLGFALGMWYYVKESIWEKLPTEFPGMQLVFGIPLVVLGGMVVFAFILGLFAGTIYRWDLEALYGRIFKKIDEILADMEELRAGSF